MGKLKRIEVKERITSFSVFDLEGSIDDAISFLKRILIDYNYTKFIIDFDCGYGDDYGNYDVYGFRLENDKEHNKRCKAREKELKNRKIEKQNQEKRERELLKKLKAKYENK